MLGVRRVSFSSVWDFLVLTFQPVPARRTIYDNQTMAGLIEFIPNRQTHKGHTNIQFYNRHHTRDRKVERKLLDVSVLPSLKWKRVRSEWNSDSILCRPPLLELDTCACLWYAEHTCPSGWFWTTWWRSACPPDQLTSCLVGWNLGSKLQFVSKFAEPEVDDSRWSVSTLGSWTCCSSPVQKNWYRVVMSSHLHRNSPKQTFKTELSYWTLEKQSTLCNRLKCLYH